MDQSALQTPPPFHVRILVQETVPYSDLNKSKVDPYDNQDLYYLKDELLRQPSFSNKKNSKKISKCSKKKLNF